MPDSRNLLHQLACSVQGDRRSSLSTIMTRKHNIPYRGNFDMRDTIIFCRSNAKLFQTAIFLIQMIGANKTVR